MDSEPILHASLPHVEEKEDGPLSKKPRAQGPFQRILPEILPSILSYIPFPHLYYRLVNKEWDNAMKLVHSLGQCNACEVHCASAEELRIRMQALTYPADAQKKEIPWLLHWKIYKCEELAEFRTMMDSIDRDVIPFLDSLQFSRCLCIKLGCMDDCDRQTIAEIANWFLIHSKPSRYTFLVSFVPSFVDFETENVLTSFLCAPHMNHVDGFCLNIEHEQTYPFAVFRDLSAMSKLKLLAVQDIHFRSHDAECLVQSPYLTNLEALVFSDVHGYDGMTGADRKIGLDTIICSPIMKNVKCLSLDTIPDLGFSIIESFAQSTFLTNLMDLCLSLDVLVDAENEKWTLEPLSRCDTTMPSLTTLSLVQWGRLSEADMRIISSPSSQLFNRIEELNLTFCPISAASMKALCESHGLKSLQRLLLNHTGLADEGLQFMASAPPSHFGNLQKLELRSNGNLTNASVLALYSSESLSNLKEIDFSDCDRIAADVLETMAELPPRPELKLLAFIFEDNMGDEAQSQARAKLAIVAPELEILTHDFPIGFD